MEHTKDPGFIMTDITKRPMSSPEKNERESSDFCKEKWVWDETNKASDVVLSSDQESAYFYVDPEVQNTGTVAVRGTRGFSEGEHYWEVVFLEPPSGTSIMIGVGTAQAALKSDCCKCANLVGSDRESWGLSYKGQLWHAGESRKYCEPFYAQGTVIGLRLDLNKGHLTFSRNGTDLGTAFTGVRASRQRRLYPMVSSSSAEAELGLGKREGRLAQPVALSRECTAIVAKRVGDMKLVDCLPLPKLVKESILEMML